MSREPSKTVMAIACAILVQTMTGLLWAGAAANRLTQVEESLAAMPDLDVRAARLEEQSENMRTALARIERKLDRALIEEQGQ